jgi:hypothetical protein
MPSLPPSRPPRRARGARLLSLRAARGAALVLAAVAAAACGGDDDPTGDDEPQIQSVRLTVTPEGGQARPSVVVRTGVTPAPVLQLPLGRSTVRADPLDAGGQVITLDEPFEMRLVATVTGEGANAQTPLSGPVSFAPGGALTGTVNATTSASVSGWVRLVHLEEAHSDFDAQVTLTAAP